MARKYTRAELEAKILSAESDLLALRAANRIFKRLVESGESIQSTADYTTVVPVGNDEGQLMGFGFEYDGPYGGRTDVLIVETGVGAGESVLNVWTGDAFLLADDWQTWSTLSARIMAERLRYWHARKDAPVATAEEVRCSDDS